MTDIPNLIGEYFYKTKMEARIALSYAIGLGYKGKVSNVADKCWVLMIEKKEEQNEVQVLETF